MRNGTFSKSKTFGGVDEVTFVMYATDAGYNLPAIFRSYGIGNRLQNFDGLLGMDDPVPHRHSRT